MANIIAVDDDPDILLVLHDALALEGHTVLPMTKPEGLAASISSDNVDLIILDVDMPGVLGFEVLKTLRDNTATDSIPVIFLSAHDDPQYRIEGLRGGAVDYIGKPFDTDEVALRVKIALGQAAAKAECRECGGDRGEVLERLRSGDTAEGISIGRYTVLESLGSGANGSVVSAWDPTLKRTVAIKTLPLDRIETAEQLESAKQLLAREREALASLSHPNIIQVFDGGEEGGVAYFVMEFASGVSLQDTLEAAEHPPNWKDALTILEHLLEALGYASEKRVVHRDVKPSNIMLTARGGCKLTDFGMALLTRELVSAPDTLAGTASYVAPEVLVGSPPSASSDLFSLGCVLYRMLTLRAPFVSEQQEPRGTAVDQMLISLREDAVPAAIANPTVPKPVSDLVSRLLAATPDERPEIPTIRAIARDLKALPGPPAIGIPMLVKQTQRLMRW